MIGLTSPKKIPSSLVVAILLNFCCFSKLQCCLAAEQKVSNSDFENLEELRDQLAVDICKDNSTCY